MGLFSAIGKVLKGVSKVAGIIPGIGGTVKGITGAVGNLLDHKSPMSTTSAKLTQLSGRSTVPVLRGKTGSYDAIAARNRAALGLPPLSVATLQQQSHVLPGGAIATSSGARSAAPTKRGGTSSRKRSSSYSRKRSRAKVKRGGKRKGTRKLKFGSAAYRKKYLGHR